MCIYINIMWATIKIYKLHLIILIENKKKMQLIFDILFFAAVFFFGKD